VIDARRLQFDDSSKEKKKKKRKRNFSLALLPPDPNEAHADLQRTLHWVLSGYPSIPQYVNLYVSARTTTIFYVKNELLQNTLLI